MDLDWQIITSNLIVVLTGSSATWIVTTVFKLRRDMDAAFRKIRCLEERLNAISSPGAPSSKSTVLEPEV